MTINRFIELLHEGNYPGDYQLCLSKVVSIPFKPSELTTEERLAMYPDGNVPAEDTYQIVSDIPLCGIAINDDDKEVRLMMRPTDAVYAEKMATEMDIVPLE